MTSSGNQIISSSEMRQYVTRYLSTYKSLVDTYKEDSPKLGNLYFYLNYPYRVVGVISETRGAAIFFCHAAEEEIEVKTIPERIEFYLWPQMKKWWDNPTVYFKVKEYEVGIFLDNQDLTVSRGGHVEIDGTLIYENRMILKGSNEKADWLPEIALIDATKEFLRVTTDLILNEAKLKKVQGLVTLRSKAEEITRKARSGTYEGNWIVEKLDYEEFMKLAIRYDIEKETAQRILEGLRKPRDLCIDIDEIDSFARIVEVDIESVQHMIPLSISEEEIKEMFREIIGEPFSKKDWPGERSDVFTTRLNCRGRRVPAAFIFKGKAFIRKPLYISDLGTRGDQIIRLFTEPAMVYILQCNGSIDSQVCGMMETYAERGARERELLYCVIDGADTARLLMAYGKI